MKLRIVVFGGLLLAGVQAMAACYTVYDHNNRVLYQGRDAPVDMSLQLHDALAQRFPRGAQMVFDQNASCTPVGLAQAMWPTSSAVPPNTIEFQRGTRGGPSSAAPAPLLTDRATAEREHLPHTLVAGDIVVVPPGAAERAMHATVTVLPSSTFVAGSAPDTSVLGAGPAPRRVVRAAPAARTRRPVKPNVVITELRDPPVTIIEGGGGVTINR